MDFELRDHVHGVTKCPMCDERVTLRMEPDSKSVYCDRAYCGCGVVFSLVLKVEIMPDGKMALQPC